MYHPIPQVIARGCRAVHQVSVELLLFNFPQGIPLEYRPTVLPNPRVPAIRKREEAHVHSQYACSSTSRGILHRRLQRLQHATHRRQPFVASCGKSACGRGHSISLSQHVHENPRNQHNCPNRPRVLEVLCPQTCIPGSEVFSVV